MKKISIYGSTGSIGTQVLEVIDLNKKNFKVMTLVCNNNIDKLIEQIKKYNPVYIYITKESDAKKILSIFPNVKVYFGETGLKEISSLNESDIYVSAMVGISGLIPTVNMIKTGKIVAIANKEVLVTGGNIIMDMVKKYKTTLLPIDSEHSAIMQCLNGENREQLNKIYLTASGGPFLKKKITDKITVNDAINHPSWSMGKKISVDSSTLINKVFEIIEAYYLFNVSPSQIEVVIHPQSLVHSMVEYKDGTIIANIGPKSMIVPISYALNYPQRLENKIEKLDLFKISNLKFIKPNFKKFESLSLAYYVLEKGLSYQIVLNAVNEVLVDAFLNNKIKYTDIMKIIKQEVKHYKGKVINNIEDIIDLDIEEKEKIRKKINF